MVTACIAIGHPGALHFLIALADIRLTFRPQTLVGLVQTRIPDRLLSFVTFDSNSIGVPGLLDTSVRHDTNTARRLERRSRGGRIEAASGAALFGQKFLLVRAACGVIIRDELETGLNLRGIFRPRARRPSEYGGRKSSEILSGNMRSRQRWLGAPSRTKRISCLANFRDRASRKAWKHAVSDLGMIR